MEARDGPHTHDTYFVIARAWQHGYGHIGLGIARQRVRGEKIRRRLTVFVRNALRRFDDIDVGHGISTTVVTLVIRRRTTTIIIKTVIHVATVVFAVFRNFHDVFRRPYAYVGSHDVFLDFIAVQLKNVVQID